MREQPNGKELLAIARQVLKESVIPNLPDEQRYNGLMIANAMAIASRQYSNEGLRQEVENLQALLAGFPVECQTVDWSAAPDIVISNASQCLITMIRDGRFDNEAPAALKNYLSLQVLQRVKESNPKALPEQYSG